MTNRLQTIITILQHCRLDERTSDRVTARIAQDILNALDNPIVKEPKKRLVKLL